MNDDALQSSEKRLKKLCGGRKFSKLSYPDLILLLEKDTRLRDILFGIFQGQAIEAPSVPVAVTHSRPMPPPMPKPAPPDPLRTQLATALDLLKTLLADKELATWLRAKVEEDEGKQLLRLAACAAQWEEIGALWDLMARRCKEQKRCATPEELKVMETCLGIHNLRWQDQRAELVHIASGTRFKTEQHERLINADTGEEIRATALPGLRSAGGGLDRKPLVQTK